MMIESEPESIGTLTKEGELERVYRLLKNWLVEGELAPGQVLSEMDLARRCASSRTPVREACSRLSQDGWLSRVRHKGYIVTPVSIADLLQLYEYRKILECFSARKAAELALPEQLDALEEVIAPEVTPGADIAQVVRASDTFHLGIAQIAGNQRVLHQLRLTLEYQHRLDCLSTRRDPYWIPHGEIIAALRSRRGAEASEAMAAHIEHARDRMLKLFGR
ncbi:MAG: GntR family transcriptional regulator [Bryobacteraceae bacterium]|nr:GntR family transcriptional regulator [Bryobacterales bacterium]MEB2362774.1 GntR family transcriptional regulator [Bryobacterales bacterium]NUN00817.1 GntR family transcriptional regulator [Bryobacteraceae bacterium]